MGRKAMIAGVICAGLGAVFTVLGIWLVIDAVQFRLDARAAIGTVTEVEYTVHTSSTTGQRTSTTTYIYHPTFRYRTAMGVTHTAKTRDGDADWNFEIGEEVDILYDPDDLDDVRIAGFFTIFTLPVVLTLAGLVLLWVGRFAIQVGRRSARPETG